MGNSKISLFITVFLLLISIRYCNSPRVKASSDPQQHFDIDFLVVNQRLETPFSGVLQRDDRGDKGGGVDSFVRHEFNGGFTLVDVDGAADHRFLGKGDGAEVERTGPLE